jgi:hypothetical protein
MFDMGESMITVFTGAGASRALGYPTTKEFFATGVGQALQKDDLYVKVARHLKTQETVDVEDLLRVLGPFAALASTDAGTFILPDLQRDHWVGRIPPYVAKVEEACFTHYGRIPETEDVKRLYEPLMDFCEDFGRRMCLFTTNYDPVTDELIRIAHSKGARAYDGFDSLCLWEPRGYSEVADSGVAIYRLHGSMCWVEDEKGIKNTRDYSQRTLRNAKHRLIYPGFKGNPERGDNAAIRFAHEALREELRAASVIIVIGFSFRDPHINTIFAESLRANPHSSMIVWNPVWPQGADVGVDVSTNEFRGRIRHLEAAFGDKKGPSLLRSLIMTMSEGLLPSAKTIGAALAANARKRNQG